MSTQTFPQTFLNGRVVVKVGDITAERVDAIANAANGTLLGGGGVDGAIHRKGGKAILDECRAIRQSRFLNGLPAGRSVATNAGALPAKFVIHTVGPVWNEGKAREEELLQSCYTSSLELAVAEGCRTAAFPAISTGAYRFPKDRAARIASEAIEAFLNKDTSLKQVVLVFFSEEDAQVFLNHQVFSS
ncbi:MAG: O-acetyl-ADP-ribose deacetylase [Candidatus Omnitrophica bacterium]|nr:O-acetyl-ADP-ribose deacetylase [Candidatus Omnitrophota bacterium]